MDLRNFDTSFQFLRGAVTLAISTRTLRGLAPAQSFRMDLVIYGILVPVATGH